MQKSLRKEKIKSLSNRLADKRLYWKNRSRFFHEQDLKYLSFLIPEGSRIIDLGCGTGDLLAALKPVVGLGIDFSQEMIGHARENHPEFEFIEGDIEDSDVIGSVTGQFQYIIISDTIGSLDDCQSSLTSLHNLCNDETRLVVSYHSYLWEPVLKVAEFLGLKMPQVEQNYLNSDDIVNLMHLSDFEVVKTDSKQLIPLNLFGLGNIVNKYIATLPLVKKLCLQHYIVARSLRRKKSSPSSCSIIIPCKNEKGNIEQAVKRIPVFCDDMEIIFIEGHSKDGTAEEISRVISTYPELDIKHITQEGQGKANATYKGFDVARGEVLMILDADLTMPPEELPKFWDAIASGEGEYINGSRLVYPMENDAMRFLNLIANRIFSLLFTWLLNQRYTDTLCGTKAVYKSDYERMKFIGGYFGNFDPFGDFFLIFCSSKLSLKMVEIPIAYKARRYGETQIHRFRNGFELLRMVIYGYKKLKAL